MGLILKISKKYDLGYNFFLKNYLNTKIVVKGKKRVFFCTQSKAANWLAAARMSEACGGQECQFSMTNENATCGKKF